MVCILYTYGEFFNEFFNKFFGEFLYFFLTLKPNTCYDYVYYWAEIGVFPKISANMQIFKNPNPKSLVNYQEVMQIYNK